MSPSYDCQVFISFTAVAQDRAEKTGNAFDKLDELLEFHLGFALKVASILDAVETIDRMTKEIKKIKHKTEKHKTYMHSRKEKNKTREK